MEGPICGYDILAYVHERFGIFLSPGQLYPILYALEKHGLIQNKEAGRRKLYVITSKPRIQGIISDYLNTHKSIMDFITTEGIQSGGSINGPTEAREGFVTSEELKASFVRDAAHELKTPLSVILASLEILKRTKPKDEEERKKLLEFLMRNSERLRDTIEEIVEAYSTEKRGYEREAVEVGEVIGEAVETHRSTVERKGLEIVMEIENLPRIMWDRKALVAVMGNLIENAVKFTENGRILITASRKNGDVVIGVQDTGIGIVDENQGSIFGKFYKISPEAPGVGIGLSFCKDAIEAHGGMIDCTSEYGEGTKFTVILPIKGCRNGGPMLQNP
jgi:signal transduction histidine kinase